MLFTTLLESALLVGGLLVDLGEARSKFSDKVAKRNDRKWHNPAPPKPENCSTDGFRYYNQNTSSRSIITGVSAFGLFASQLINPKNITLNPSRCSILTWARSILVSCQSTLTTTRGPSSSFTSQLSAPRSTRSQSGSMVGLAAVLSRASSKRTDASSGSRVRTSHTSTSIPG